MSPSTDADLVSVTSELQPALARYAEEARRPFDGPSGELGATLAWLEERLTSWLAVAQRCQEEVSELTSALRRCQTADDPESDDVEGELHDALIRLGAAQDELAGVRRWAHTLVETQLS